MKPTTPDELAAMLMFTMMTRLYGDVTTEARKRRLTDHDIETIERTVLAFKKDTDAFAKEFPFQTEVVVARVFNDLKQFLAAAKSGRIKHFQQK